MHATNSHLWVLAFNLVFIASAAGCADEGSQPAAEVRQPLTGQSFDLALDRPGEAPLESLVVVASEDLLFSHDTSVVAIAGQTPIIANTGAVRTEVSQHSSVGSIVSVSSVRLEQGVVVEGSIKTSGTLTNKKAVVTGSITENSAIAIQHEVLEPVAVPLTASPPITVKNGEVHSFAPGGYDAIVAEKGATVKLAAGRYYVGTLDLQKGSDLQVDDAGGAILVYVVNQLSVQAVTSDSPVASPALLVSYIGEQDVEIGGVFRGTLVASKAHVHIARPLKHSGAGNPHDAVHVGSFFGKQVVVQPHTNIQHASFPWEVFLVGQEVKPVLTCVLKDGDRFFAVFGYENTSTVPVEIPVGFSNEFTPDPSLPGQPTIFQPGLHVGFFPVPIDSDSVQWRLGGGVAQATPASQPCSPLGTNDELDDDLPEKVLPEGTFVPPPVGITFQEMSSNGFPFAQMVEVEIPGPQALIHGDRGTRAVEVVLANSTSSVLTFANGIGEGKITLQPPSAIAPGTYGTWETRDGKALQGTGGHNTFTAPGLSVTVNWNNPFIGSNDYSYSLTGSLASQFAVDVVGGSGNKSDRLLHPAADIHATDDVCERFVPVGHG